MSHLFLTLVLAAGAPGQPSLASPGFSSPNLPEKKVTFFADHLAHQLAMQGLNVVTKTEVNTLLGAERQRALAGCSDSQTSACIAELANALGVDGIITGSVAKVGRSLHVTVKVIASGNARQLALYDDSASSEEALLDQLTAVAVELAAQIRGNLAATLPSGRQTAGVAASNASEVGLRLSRNLGWAPMLIGGVLFVGGAAVTGVSWARFGALTGGDRAAVGADPAAFARDAQTMQTVGLVCAGVGAALGIAGALVLSLGEPSPRPMVLLFPGGVGLGIAGRLP